MFRIFKPEVFQGSLKKHRYFEGWYFKNVSNDLSHVYAFIPGISLTKKDRHAFIQVIDGITGKTNYIRYDLETFKYRTDKLYAEVGRSSFSSDKIHVDLEDDGLRIEGTISFVNPAKYPGSLLAPGIMGWYSYVPFMECYHGVVSANHSLSGHLMVNGKKIDFESGKGYIEKDWGRSFPECWIWLQSNSFETEEMSLFVSIAKIPWLGSYFMGFISFLYHQGEFIKFTTYNGSKLVKTEKKDKELIIGFSNKKYAFDIHVSVKNTGDLIAPVKGDMSRMIKESVDSEVSFNLKNIQTGEQIKGHSKRAGLEIIEGIFDYF